MSQPKHTPETPSKSADLIGAYVTAADKAEAIGYDPTSRMRDDKARQATLATTAVWRAYTPTVAREVQHTIDAAAFPAANARSFRGRPVGAVCRRVARELAARNAHAKYGGSQ